ncbi:hypothetical protein H310_05506 [Aphanomyces invadans]|uniref:Pyridoxamine 5'-phosphate oxidase Alr4036 family FMN-binding domain-containing protein n=1 Tax=Aphanomyces invadans TaxID=157072 RepID=A0A024UBR9_9STRA|nr:hypothetical protein H310_05506 [Aphanomyces invadans]ETW03078.1 hypothetical protein H310_05506 [Aphanomyces invadans]|eukprot:XP_008868462.1 hypothetical protein H310_05506 [Aphanomyces invadans]
MMMRLCHSRMASSLAPRQSGSNHCQWFEKIKVSIEESHGIRGGNYVQLATVDSDGLPHCRTVVFRGFFDMPSGDLAMKMITDSRSDKVHQIQHSPFCEMVWWFSQTSEQYRIAGHLEVVPSDADGALLLARTEQWNALSDAAKAQFYWPHPGVYDPHVASRDTNAVEDGGPPTSFLLVLLHPTMVKYLRLTDNATLNEVYLPSTRTWERLSYM